MNHREITIYDFDNTLAMTGGSLNAIFNKTVFGLLTNFINEKYSVNLEVKAFAGQSAYSVMINHGLKEQHIHDILKEFPTILNAAPIDTSGLCFQSGSGKETKKMLEDVQNDLDTYIVSDSLSPIILYACEKLGYTLSPDKVIASDTLQGSKVASIEKIVKFLEVDPSMTAKISLFGDSEQDIKLYKSFLSNYSRYPSISIDLSMRQQTPPYDFAPYLS